MAVWEDEFVNLQSRYRRGIFSLNTVLLLCDLTDRTPEKFFMTFSSTNNLSGPKAERILCCSAKEPLYGMEIIKLLTSGGNTVRAYRAERTLYDIIRTKKHTDVQSVLGAFKRYVADRNRNILQLSEYTRLL